jgi:hypothetical protein
MIICPYTDPGRTLLTAPSTKMASEGTGILRESYSTDNTNFSQCAILEHTSQLLIISSKLNVRGLIKPMR